MLNLHKINKLAVLLCGDFRAWPRASEYIFKYADYLSDDVDYYFSTWNNTSDYWYTGINELKTKRPVTDDDVTKEFIKYNKNLINYRLSTHILDQHTNTYYYQSYLAKIANVMKRRYELDNNFIYDQVVEMRPDLYINAETSIIADLNDFECLLYIENPGDITVPGAADLHYRSNSFGNDIMANRFYHQKSFALKYVKNFTLHNDIINNHQILADYMYQKRIKSIQGIGLHKQVVIRTNFPLGDLDKADYDGLLKLEKEYKIHNRTSQ